MENVGLLKQIWRFITFYKWRKSLAVGRAADAQFTSSAAGISDAYDLHHEQLITEFKDFMGALTAVETAVEDKRLLLETTQKNLETERKAVNGAVTVYTKAEAAGDTAKMAEAKEKGNQFRQNVKRLEAEEAQLKADITAQEEELRKLEGQLGTMKAEIDKLPQDKANAISQYISNSKLVDAYERLNGLKSRLDRGPIDAVTQANKELAAKARVTGRVVGAANRDVQAEYINAGESDAADDDFEKLVAARKAEKAGNTGAADTKTTDREKI